MGWGSLGGKIKATSAVKGLAGHSGSGSATTTTTTMPGIIQ